MVNGLAKAVRMSPVMVVPGNGRSKCGRFSLTTSRPASPSRLAVRAATKSTRSAVPISLTFDDLVRLLMEITGRRRPLLHVPENLLLIAGAIAEKLPGALFSRDAVAFLVADNDCEIQPLLAESD